MIPLHQARTRITTLWYVGTLIFVGLLVLQSLSSRYGGRVEDVWKWGLPMVLPTAMLMLGVHAGPRKLTVAARPEEEEGIEPLFYRVTIISSALYLGAVIAVLVMTSYTDGSVHPADYLAKQSWLSALQALPTGAYGYLYARH